MISETQASARRISVNVTDHSSTRQHDLLGSSSTQRREDVLDPGERPTRDANAAGLHRIVNGMRAALRSKQNINVTRKEISHYAGVTPALITYYFPEKDSLIEAVAVPIVVAMVEAVMNSLNKAGEPREKLLNAVDILIESYAKDAVIIDLFIAYQSSRADKLPDLIGQMEADLVAFFNQWLQDNHGRIYDAAYLQKAAIGLCKIVARREQPAAPQESSPESRRLTQAEAICAMLLEPGARTDGTAPVAGPGSAI